METTIEKTPLQLAEDLRFKILLLSNNMKYAKEQFKGIEIEMKANIIHIELDVLKSLADLVGKELTPPDERFNFSYLIYETEHCRILISSKEIN